MNVALPERIEPENKPLKIKDPAENKPTRREPAPRRPSFPGQRWLMLVMAIAAAVGVGWYAYTQVVSREKSKSEGQTIQRDGKATLGFISNAPSTQPAKSRAPQIQTAPVEVADRSDVLRLTASLIADEQSNVASNASGIAAEVLVDRGSIVKKNDVLVQIDPTDAKNKLTEGLANFEELKARLGLGEDMSNFNPEDEPEVRLAKASADLAESNLQRAKEMFAKKVISTEAYDQTRTEFELATQRYRQALLLIKQAYQACQTAMAKIAILHKAVADTTIRAPFDGWVAEKLVSPGEQISSGMQATKVVTLVRIDPLRLSLTVPQQDVGSVQPGQKVRFRVDSFPDRSFDATVKYIAPVVTNNTRSMVVEAIVPNPDGALRPGMFATAELLLSKRDANVFVPSSAVERTGEVARVFIVRDGVAREQVVALGEAEKGKVEIRAGLTGKETIVVNPSAVRDGDVIHP